MQVLFVKIVFVLTSLLWCGDTAAARAAENAPVALLRNVCRQLTLCANVSPVSFQLFGMPSALMVLNLPESPAQLMQRLQGTSSPFSQLTRVGNQVFYSGSFGQTSLQLVVDVLRTDTTHALLSATTLPPAGTGPNPAVDPSRLPGRRMLQLLPDGARLLMDICYADRERNCHQVYVYARLSTEQLASALKTTLIAANWQVQSTAAGLATWVRHGQTLQYFLANVNGNATLYLTAPAILW
jgi:enamine deaminase RidA (YjgF/YER057c/UK114 family)